MIHLMAKDILQRYQIKTFVETGTFEGDTLELIESWKRDLPYLKSLYGVDLWDKAIEMTQVRTTTAQLFLGNSVDWLRDNIHKIETPALFFLDAHTFGWLPDEQQAISNTYSPENQLYIQELKVLLPSDKPMIICIDDWNAEYNLSQSKHILDHVWVTNTCSPSVHGASGRPSAYYFNNLDENLLTGLDLTREE